jgi:hypothetical protein
MSDCLEGFDELPLIRFFKECPHPDDKQRKELSRELGLEPLQVKFWFQNKRTQMKASSTTTLDTLFLIPGINIILYVMQENIEFLLDKFQSICAYLWIMT